MTAQRTSRDYLQDMLYAIEKIEQFTAGIDFAQFASDEKTHFAVIRAIEVLGEAARQLPEGVKQRHPTIPWRDMIGMRDKVIHGYFGVILMVVWQTVEQDIPTLKPLLKDVFDIENERERGKRK